MSKALILQYILEIAQEEECSLWDAMIVNPKEWLDREGRIEINWISEIVTKMLATYKE